MRANIIELIQQLQEAYQVGLMGGMIKLDFPETPYHIILGNALTGAWKNGKIQQLFRFADCAKFISNLPSTINDGDIVGELYNPVEVGFDVIWVEAEQRIKLKLKT